MRLALLLAVLASGCFEDRYRCSNDSQCDLGEGGRCEADGRCTVFDATCPTQHRYTPHSEQLTGTCFDDRQPLVNLCAGGQAPALSEQGDTCIARVCATLPACCEVGWIDACVQAAQLETTCSLSCTTSIALTATKGARSELWELTWTGTGWNAMQNTDLQRLIAWVGPAPGTAAPRLAGLAADDGATLKIGANHQSIDAKRAVQSITTIDVDRDGRDTVVFGYDLAGPPVTRFAQVIKLDTAGSRDIDTRASQFLSWGDINRDGFPDGVAGGAANSYFLLKNEDGGPPDHVRSLSNGTSSGIGVATKTDLPPVRSIDWLDFDNDQELDLVVAGNTLHVHAGATGIGDTPRFNFDCDPPAPANSCSNTAGEFSHIAIALPTSEGPRLASAPFRDTTKPPQVRAVYTIDPGQHHTTLAFTDTCTTNCIPIIALVARDLDGDHEMDLVAIDANLNIYTALGAQKFRPPQAIPSALTAVTEIAVSVTGL